MKTQENRDVPMQHATLLRQKRGSWLMGLGALLVVAVLVGVSITVFARLSQQRGKNGSSQGKTQLPPSGQWVQVLHGYTILSVQAAQSNPAVLYVCAIKASTNGAHSARTPLTYTLLRSGDSGTHWQDIGGKAQLHGACQLAVNPDNASEVYVESGAVSSGSSGLLEHSTDGGQNWQTITPAFTAPSQKMANIWHVQQLSMAGNHLFGLQWGTPGTGSVPPRGAMPGMAGIFHLVTSTDGGHSWQVLDDPLTQQKVAIRSYVVDPSHINVIYAIAGSLWQPIHVPTAEPDQNIAPPSGFMGTLYKTTDNGASWKAVLEKLPVGARVQLAAGDPATVYAGGVILPIEYGTHMDTTMPSIGGNFHLHVSHDGGANWHEVVNLPQSAFIKGWFVGFDGSVYISANFISNNPGEKQTPAGGTTPSVTPHTMQPGAQQNKTVAYRPQTTPISFTQGILRYDPAANAWKQLTTPPASGTLMGVTPADTQGGTILWFMEVVKGEVTLDRYVV